MGGSGGSGPNSLRYLDFGHSRVVQSQVIYRTYMREFEKYSLMVVPNVWGPIK